MSDTKNKIEQNRRDFLLAASAVGVAGAYMATAGFNPAIADELIKSDKPLKRPSPTPACRRPGVPRASRRPRPGAS